MLLDVDIILAPSLYLISNNFVISIVTGSNYEPMQIPLIVSVSDYDSSIIAAIVTCYLTEILEYLNCFVDLWQ